MNVLYFSGVLLDLKLFEKIFFDFKKRQALYSLFSSLAMQEAQRPQWSNPLFLIDAEEEGIEVIQSQSSAEKRAVVLMRNFLLKAMSGKLFFKL